MNKIVIIEKGKYNTHYSIELEETIDDILDRMNEGEQLIITISKPDKIIRGNY